jgi:uncharacterized protein YjbI with pentapeptide repeats
LRLSSHKKENSYNPKLRLIVFGFLFLVIGIFLGWKDIPGHLKANFVIFQELDLWGLIKDQNSLPNLKLEISFKGMQTLDAKRKDALDTGLLVSSEDDFVKAKISNLNENFNCKVRLKGDLADHWSGEKFSLRVEMKDGSLIRGMSRFSLQDPITRNNTSEWLFQQSLKREGLMGVRYEFVNLFINGRFMGIYAMEEHFSKELIEANSRREGVIVNFNDSLLWKKFPVNLRSNIDWNSIYRSAPVDVRNNKRVQKNEVLNKQKVTAINLLRSLQESSLPASQIFDPEKLGKFLAITRLWGAEKALFYGDINFYFNPVTCLLEPIGFDGNPSQEIDSPYCYFSWGDIKESWVNYSLTDPKITANYISCLFKFTNNEYLSALSTDFRSTEVNFRNLLSRELLLESSEKIWKNFGLINFDPWSNLELRAQGVRDELNEKILVQGYGKKSDENKSIEIIVRNTTTQPVEIKGFTSGDKFWPAIDYFADDRVDEFNENVLLFGQGNGFRQTEKDKEFFLPFNASTDPIMVQVRFLGSSDNYINCMIPIDEHSFDPMLLPTNKVDTFNRDSFPFILEENETLWIPPGRHVCKDDLYIAFNQKLKISPGAEILFDRNSTFVSEGSIQFLGTSTDPIIISSSGDSWAGFLLANASGNSVFENVKFSNISGIGKGPNPMGITQNGWTLTGGITIYNSIVEFTNCSFSNFTTEDALNIISSSFTLSDCHFSSHFSDAFDGDFVNGNITNCTFSNISGDGVDFSGSTAVLRNCSFKDIADKAVSVGESSQVKVFNCKIKGVSFGVVSKDMSATEVLENTEIKNAKIAAFAAFQKKDWFGPASIKISNSQTIGCQKLALIQEGSQASFDGEIIETISFQTTDLYKTK